MKKNKKKITFGHPDWLNRDPHMRYDSIKKEKKIYIIVVTVEPPPSLFLQEMIIDKVDDKPVPRFLIYDIVMFEVGILNSCMFL